MHLLIKFMFLLWMLMAETAFGAPSATNAAPVKDTPPAKFVSLPTANSPSSYFIAGTQIAQKTGSISIEKLTEGDRIIGIDVLTKKRLYGTVLHVSAMDIQECVEVQLLHEGKIKSLPEQRFWVDKQGWKLAAKLFPGDQILQRNGSFARVFNVLVRREPAHVYKLDLKGLPNYFVGSTGLLVAS